MSVLAASTSWTVAKPGHSGWSSHGLLILVAIVVVVAIVGFLLKRYSDYRSYGPAYVKPVSVEGRLIARLNCFDESDHSEICYRLARGNSAHQGALHDILLSLESEQDSDGGD